MTKRTKAVISAVLFFVAALLLSGVIVIRQSERAQDLSALVDALIIFSCVFYISFAVFVESAFRKKSTPEEGEQTFSQTKRRSFSRKALAEICVCAVMAALSVVLNRFCSFQIVSTGIKIGFSFIPPMLVSALYGPLAGARVYGISDVVGAILFPSGPFHPGFTVTVVLIGLTYGLFLYPHPLDIHRERFDLELKWKRVEIFPNIIFAVLISCVVFGIFLNSAWLCMLYGKKTYWAWIVGRLPEYGVMIPLQMILAFPIVKLSHALRKQGFGR